ncbi:MAG: hypothetical protein JWM82_1783 [Myxococcales bacterium]|nr:hypothetical protein [Myxococcales bacterium]
MTRFLLAALGLSLTLTAASSCNLSLVDCTKVSVDACGNTRGCLLLYAEPVRAPDDPAKACLLPALPVSCGNPHICDKQSPSLAQDATGKRWLLQSACVPAGWTRLSTSASFDACPSCQRLTVLTCASDDSCQKVYGRRIDATRSCLLTEEAVGCYDAATVCNGGHATRWVDASGQEWILPASCPGPGLTNSTSRNTTLGLCASSDGGDPDGGGNGDAANVDCASLPFATCAATAGCRVLEGQQINQQRSCVLPSKAAGCQRDNNICGAALTRATDPTGKEWVFPSTCIPTGWTSATGNDAFVPDCSSLGGPTDGATDGNNQK